MSVRTPTIEPELYTIRPTPYVPNSRLPIVLYRNALQNPTPEGVKATIEPNRWFRGGQWKAYYHAHFHAITHECYGVISGAAVFNLGKSPLDDDLNEKGEKNGIAIQFNKGDVFVLPAGISHCVLHDLGDFEYVGLYPPNPIPVMCNADEEQDRKADEEAFDMHLCKETASETTKLKKIAASTPIPSTDPLYGTDGPLPRLWREADQAYRASRAKL